MKACISIIWMLVAGSLVFGQSEDARERNFNIKKNVAIEGYDPVSYYDNKPSEGKPALPFTYKGVTYWFVNETNRNKFKTMPEKFEPAYGGWCAYAMGATGEKVKIDPETYKILEGKLFLFYNFWSNNTLTEWNKSEKEYKTKGDANWKKFIP